MLKFRTSCVQIFGCSAALENAQQVAQASGGFERELKGVWAFLELCAKHWARYKQYNMEKEMTLMSRVKRWDNSGDYEVNPQNSEGNVTITG